MAGVDFVINALFETSGLRCDGDCANALPIATENITKAMKKKLIGFTALILFLSAECKSGKALPHSKTSPLLRAHFALAFWSAAALRRFRFLTDYLQVP